MDITFLAADRPLTKTFSLDDHGSLVKTSAPMVYDVTSHTVQISTIDDFYNAICAAAARGWCLLKGNTIRPLVVESRAGSTDSILPTSWLCLDLDAARFPDPDAFMQAIGMPDVSYVLQWSSSHGIENKPGLRCHIFVLLSTAALPEFLKRWLRTLNLSTQALAQALELAASGLALRWSLDVSTCQNDKLIYISPPVLGPGITDPIAGNRILLIKKDKDCAPSLVAWSESKLRELQNITIDAMREAQGFPKHKLEIKVKGDVEYMAKANAAVQWEAREARGFTYFNLNGGDSWAYYHPRNSPAYIYNFKGEPAYRTSELLPDYWNQLRERTEQLTPSNDGLVIFGVRERITSKYFSLVLDTQSQALRTDHVDTEHQLRSWMFDQGAVPPTVIPTWEFQFLPQSTVVLDPEAQIVNTFVPSDLMLARPETVGEWPTIHRVMHHALGSDSLVTSHWLNWLACAYQLRTILGTGWMFQGIQGTGKGVIQNLILAPLFGRQNVSFATLHNFDAGWTDFLEDKLLCLADEMNIEATTQASRAMALIKNIITEPSIMSRRKYAQAATKANHVNLIFFSNMPNPIELSQADRRFNVGGFQLTPIIFDDSDAKNIALELPHFAEFLRTYQIDRENARKPLVTEARADLIELNMSAADLIARALRAGDLRFLIDQLPDDLAGQALSLSTEAVRRDAYIALMRGLVTAPRDKLTRTELHTLFAAQAGNVPPDGTKFSHYLKHRGVSVKRIWVDNRTAAGIVVEWKIDSAWLEETRTWLLSTKSSLLKKSA